MDKGGCYIPHVSEAANDRGWGNKRGCEGAVGGPWSHGLLMAKEVKVVFATGGRK